MPDLCLAPKVRKNLVNPKGFQGGWKDSLRHARTRQADIQAQPVRRILWWADAVLVLTLSAIACYALTLAPVTWVLIAEIIPTHIRSHAISASVSALWIASFLLTFSFPILERTFGTAGIFAGYGVICLAGFVLVALFVPETRGRSLEQISLAVTVNR
jgi:hypothetical protein